MTQILSEREAGVAALPSGGRMPAPRAVPVRIYVVDAHPVVGEGLARIVALHGVGDVVGIATSGEQALSEVSAGTDLVMVAQHLAGELTGPELSRELSREPHHLACLGMSDRADAVAARDFLAAGAAGVLVKSSSGDAIRESVVVAASGRPYLDPLLLDPWGGGGPDTLTQVAPLSSPLTATEHKILHRVAEGASNKEIAAALGVSASAVKGHVSHLLHKLGARSRTEAVAVSVRRGLVALASIDGRGP